MRRVNAVIKYKMQFTEGTSVSLNGMDARLLCKGWGTCLFPSLNFEHLEGKAHVFYLCILHNWHKAGS